MKQSEKYLWIMENEIWAAIPGYEEYLASSFGRIKRLSYYRKTGINRKQFVQEHILKQYDRGNGYLFVVLCKDGISKSFSVHRLVALSFLPNPKNLPMINHKDENRKNNVAENLEWCTAKYNSNYGSCGEKISKKLTNGALSKPVRQYDMRGVFVREYPSAREAARLNGIGPSGINDCCAGRLATCHGYQWRYANSDKEIKNKAEMVQDFNIGDKVRIQGERRGSHDKGDRGDETSSGLVHLH